MLTTACPSWFSGWTTKTRTVSPMLSACFSSWERLEYSRAGTTPSDFEPMSTNNSSRSTCMMTPSITSPYFRLL